MSPRADQVEPHRWLATSQRAFDGLAKCATDGFAFADLRVSTGLLQCVSTPGVGIGEVVATLFARFEPEKVRIVTDGDRREVLAALRARVDLTKVIWHEYSNLDDAEAADANFCMPEPSVRRHWERAGCLGPLSIGGDPQHLGADFRTRWALAFEQLVQALEAEDPGALEPDVPFDASVQRPEPLPDRVATGEIEGSRPGQSLSGRLAWPIARFGPRAANSSGGFGVARALDRQVDPVHARLWSSARWADVDVRLEAQWHGTVVSIRLSGPLAVGSMPPQALRFVDGQTLIALTGPVRWSTYPTAAVPYASAMFELGDPQGTLWARLSAPTVEPQLLGGVSLTSDAAGLFTWRAVQGVEGDVLREVSCKLEVDLPGPGAVGQDLTGRLVFPGCGDSDLRVDLAFDSPLQPALFVVSNFELQAEVHGARCGSIRIEGCLDRPITRWREVTTVRLLPPLSSR